MIDGYFRVIYSEPNLLVPWYLMTSYLYYDQDKSVLSDELFDWICKELDRCWDIIEHRHKSMIDRGSLASGTGFYLDFNSLPMIIKSAAWRLNTMAEIDHAKQKSRSHGHP